MIFLWTPFQPNASIKGILTSRKMKKEKGKEVVMLPEA